jgi:hypothetical protein
MSLFLINELNKVFVIPSLSKVSPKINMYMVSISGTFNPDNIVRITTGSTYEISVPKHNESRKGKVGVFSKYFVVQTKVPIISSIKIRRIFFAKLQFC